MGNLSGSFSKYALRGTVALVFAVVIVPIFIYGKDSIVTTYDSMDWYFPWAKMLKDNSLLLALDSPTNSWGNMSTAYFAPLSYNVTNFLFLFFDAFTAFVLEYLLRILIGFVSMYALLRRFFADDKNKAIVTLVSLAYGLLPTIPTCWICSAPLLAYFFIVIAQDFRPNKIDKRIFWLLFFPVISDFALSGFFLLCLWLSGTIVFWVKDKKLNWNLALGLVILTAGYVLVYARLFYAMFVLQEPLARELHATSQLEPFKYFVAQAFQLLLQGHFNAPSIVVRFIWPVGAICLASAIVFVMHKIIRKRYESKYDKFCIYVLVSIGLLALSVCFSVIGAIWGTTLQPEINKIFPFLAGFGWGRIMFLNRVPLYIWFCCTLILISGIRKFRYLTYILAVAQICRILTSPVDYNFTALNLERKEDAAAVTYNEFFAQELFDKIKNDLNYNGEGVAAVGYNSGVLMYNNFSCVDGYNNTYPLSYTVAFREIIAPQLENNQEDRLFYDSTVARLYLYCDDAPYEATKTRITEPITLRINTEAFKKLGGVYILSRGEIRNAAELKLNFVRSYTDKKFIYDIYVYRAI